MLFSIPMPRIARVVVPGIPHHVTQRGNYQQAVFRSDEERNTYLRWMKQYSSTYELRVWAYSLMDNHVHFIVVPENDDSMARTFNQVHMRFSQLVNHRLGRRGHLWQGRFFSCPLDETHLYAAVRYVETDAVRSGLVGKAEDFVWSSARSHIFANPDELLSNDLPLINEIEDWREYLAGSEDQLLIDRLRKCTASGYPAGNERFVRGIEQLSRRSLRSGKRGRPRKREGEKS